MYSVEHLIFVFSAGVVLGVVSTIFFTKREMTIEMIIALLLMSLWVGLHVYAFFFDNEVDWIFNIVGFGAVGTFVGINLRQVTGVREVFDLISKRK